MEKNSNSNSKFNMDKTLMDNEEILTEMSNRFVMFPIRYNQIWAMYKKAESAFWAAEEIDFSKDIDDWNKLNDNEQHFIKHILAFFAASDGIVNENLSVRFMNDVKAPEAKAFYGFQIAMENIHCVTYNTAILTDIGYIPIGSVEGKVKKIWNGQSFKDVMIMKTSQKPTQVYTVTISNGMNLTCTPNHEWLIQTQESYKRIMTKDLENGMELKPFSYPIELLNLDSSELFYNAEHHGKATCLDPEMYNPTKYYCCAQSFVPSNFDLKTKKDWLRGLFSNALFDDETNDLYLYHKDKQFLLQVQLLLTTMLIDSKVSNNTLTIPNTIYGLKLLNDFEIVNTKTIYRKEKEKLHIVSIEKESELMETFCFEEPETHCGLFNGILTGQSETYSLMIDTYIKDSMEKSKLLNAINTIPCVTKKAEWAMKWITDKNAPFAMRLVAFAVVEGLFFSGAFCSIFWLKERGVMPGLCTSNEFISRDESLHTEFAILLYSMLNNKLEEGIIYDIVKEAVEIEEEFINESIPCNLLGMNADLMSQYIKFVADRLVVQLGYSKIYNVSNPFSFMDRISLSQKTNFFEFKSTSEYAKASVGNDQQSIHKFTLDADF